MSKIVFDIETVGDFESLDKESREYILKYAKTDEEREDAKKNTSLWPLTGQVVTIAILNPDTDKGKVFFQAPDSGVKDFSEDGVDFVVGKEKEILKNFWQTIKNFDQFITFNGRGMDCPYLILRSGILKVEPTKNLMPPRFSVDYHVDLLEQLTFYGAFRKFSLDFYCRSFGIKSPKEEGLSGDKVGEYFKAGKHEDIARYCLRDVRATAELYRRWVEFMEY